MRLAYTTPLLWWRWLHMYRRTEHWLAWTKEWNNAYERSRLSTRPIVPTFAVNLMVGMQKRDRLVANLLSTLSAHELAGIVIGIYLDDLNDALRVRAELIEMFGTPYPACSQWVSRL